MPVTLKQMELVGEIDMHSDILSISPSALSTKRARKVGRITQEQMQDKDGGSDDCILCHPNKKEARTSMNEVIIQNRVGGFINDFPYLPMDQWVMYLWNEDEKVRSERLHRLTLDDHGSVELYWLLSGCLKKGRTFTVPKQTNDSWRMVVGFNIGKLAGQSIPHHHAQYGWDVALNPKIIKPKLLDLYFEELEEERLLIYKDDIITLMAPWTPKGQFAVELYFNNKYDFAELDTKDVKYFACFGESIIKKYLKLGIQNMNIVFANSPFGRETEPLVAHFVPRVNMPALYEMKGVNVVDTPPQNIALEFNRFDPHKNEGVVWPEVAEQACSFDPDMTYEILAGLA